MCTMSTDQPIDIDQVGSDDSSMASRSSLEADAAVAPLGNDEDAADMDLQQMLGWQ